MFTVWSCSRRGIDSLKVRGKLRLTLYHGQMHRQSRHAAPTNARRLAQSRGSCDVILAFCLE